MTYKLHDHLKKLSLSGKKRFHMPGHKGKGFDTLLDDAYQIDYTEIPDTGNLFSPDFDIISMCEQDAARFFGGEICHFLTCGATQGIKAALAIFQNGENSILLDRNVHKSLMDGCGLLGIDPIYISPNFDGDLAITKDFDLSQLDQTLKENREISAFFITSPTYYGYCHDISAIKSVCEKYDVKLLVDSAHGSHMVYWGKSALQLGADCAIYSAHKTLNALTQGAYLVLKKSHPKSMEMSALFGTTSPSYPIMASLDIAFRSLETLEKSKADSVVSACFDLRQKVQAMGFICPNLGDPLRITINCGDFDVTGFDLYEQFRKHFIEPEMADAKNVVFIVTFSDDICDIIAIGQALEKIKLSCNFAIKPKEKNLFPPIAQKALSPRQAMFVKTEKMPIKDCLGKISAENIFQYPPGVPIIAKGEIIDKKTLEYFVNICYNIDNEIDVACNNN